MKTLRSSLQEKIAFLRLKSGDSEAFGFFYDKYVKNIYRFIYIKVTNRQLAEDLTQEVFLKVWQHLVDKKNIKSFQAFIFRIARNSVVDHYRASNSQELPLEYISELADMSKSITTEVDKSIDAAVLLQEIRKLKPEYQEVLILRYIEDLSIDDISDVMQKDKNNIRVTLHRALNKLKQIIQEKNNR
ncbi:RNA polymerase sigma factor [Patescibacteria group bacterium]|nr:RNA polymerase sigma factor [Patescibacteria group bacterium]